MKKALARRLARDGAVTVALLAAASVLCALLRSVAESAIAAPLIFVLCVLLISRLTDGYVWGIAASLFCVLFVNYMFTYPFMELNFSIAGYPLTFVTLLAVSLSTSALTTGIKRQEKLKLEAERERMRTQLLRAVSHDLRTPLTAIAGSVGAVLDNEAMPAAERRELLAGVRDDAAWLIRMVENLLSVTRMREDGADLVKTEEAAEEVVSGAVLKFRKRFPDVGARVSVPEDVLFVPMDAVLVSQVLMNLMENAVYHGGHTSCVQVSVEKHGEGAVFSVEDDGEGLSPRALDAILTDGAGVPPTDAGGRHNMGIGLAVCQAIVRAHGGQLGAENRPGGGARFYFTLPLA